MQQDALPEIQPGGSLFFRELFFHNGDLEFAQKVTTFFQQWRIHMSDRTRFLLDETKVPKAWYNINADMPVPPQPVLHPGTLQPVTPDFLSVLFPMSLIGQEVSKERWIEIPEPVREIYRLWRPTPMCRAIRLEKALGTPAHIYYKYEGASPVGSHKPNTAVAQAFYNKEAGTKAMTTETGAGQWGTALAMACNFFNIDLEVYMVNVSYHQKPYRRVVMENYGSKVFASPSRQTAYGRKLLAQDPGSQGSLGIAISEAVEAAASSGGKKKYGIGAGACAPAPDSHRSGIAGTDGIGGGVPRHRDRVRRGRIQFCGIRLPVSPQKPDAGEPDAAHRRRAGFMPQPDEGEIHV